MWWKQSRSNRNMCLSAKSQSFLLVFNTHWLTIPLIYSVHYYWVIFLFGFFVQFIDWNSRCDFTAIVLAFDRGNGYGESACTVPAWMTTIFFQMGWKRVTFLSPFFWTAFQFWQNHSKHGQYISSNTQCSLLSPQHISFRCLAPLGLVN